MQCHSDRLPETGAIADQVVNVCCLTGALTLYNMSSAGGCDQSIVVTVQLQCTQRRPVAASPSSCAAGALWLAAVLLLPDAEEGRCLLGLE